MQGLLVVPDPAAPFHNLFMAIVLYVNDALRGNRGCPAHTKSFPATLLKWPVRVCLQGRAVLDSLRFH